MKKILIILCLLALTGCNKAKVYNLEKQLETYDLVQTISTKEFALSFAYDEVLLSSGTEPFSWDDDHSNRNCFAAYVTNQEGQYLFFFIPDDNDIQPMLVQSKLPSYYKLQQWSSLGIVNLNDENFTPFEFESDRGLSEYTIFSDIRDGNLLSTGVYIESKLDSFIVMKIGEYEQTFVDIFTMTETLDVSVIAYDGTITILLHSQIKNTPLEETYISSWMIIVDETD